MIRISMNKVVNDAVYSNLGEMLKAFLCGIRASSEKSYLPGISTGLPQLDGLIDGFENGKVYVIGGRPCMGKEELMLSMILDALWESKLPVLFFSTNHQKADYVTRLLSIHCEIPTTHLIKSWLEANEWERLDKGIRDLFDAPLLFHDSQDLPLAELMETAKICIKDKGVRIIFIDCLQMIDLGKKYGNASERIAKVLCDLKQLAMSANVPIVVGSMLNRNVDYREGPEGRLPQLMDLANSCYIEGMADVVMMVNRPEYYHIYQDEDGRELHGLMQVLVKKNSLKPLGDFWVRYHQETGVISILEGAEAPVSKPVSLDNLETDNPAVWSLVKNLGLEEV